MPSRTAADDALTPAEFERLFKTAARIGTKHLSAEFKNLAIEVAFLLYMMARLGPRLGTILHFDQDNVLRNQAGEIVAIHIPEKVDCTCSYCWMLASKRASNADDEDVEPEDFIDEYWSPKTPAGGREIPVMTERGREIIDLYLSCYGEVDMSHQTVRRRLTLLAELTSDIDPDRLTPQSARASTATYWISFPGFDPSALQLLMGWKHLKTAHYYLGCTQARLRTAMQRALGKQVVPAFDVDTEPATFTDLRPDDPDDRIQIEYVTPNTEPAQHAAPDVLHPLEEEAQQRLGEFKDLPMDGIKAAQPVTLPAFAAAWSTERTAERLCKEWEDFLGDDGALPGPTKAARGAVIASTFLLGLGGTIALTGIHADPNAPLGIHFPSTVHAIGLFTGLTVGTGTVLRTDHQVRNNSKTPFPSRETIHSTLKRVKRRITSVLRS